MFYAYKKIKEHRRQKALAQEVALQDTTAEPSAGPYRQVLDTNTNTNTAAPAKAKKELTPEEIADKKRRNVYRWKLIAGLFGPFALQALDTTIIASALSDIATEFRKSLPPPSM